MQKIITLTYTIATAVLAGVMTIMHIQPAYFLMTVFTTSGGREYYIAPVYLITWLILLMPMLIIMLIARQARLAKKDEIIPGRTAIVVLRKKAFSSAMVGIPLFVNGEKAGVVDNGRMRFIEVPSGKLTLQAGSGKQASLMIETEIASGQQLQFLVQLINDGLTMKCLLIQG